VDEQVHRSRPGGRFKRLWMEFEVEVVDEIALRSFDLVSLTDGGDGGDDHAGAMRLLGISDNGRVAAALNQIVFEAWSAAESRTGVRVLGGSGPVVRRTDTTGTCYTELMLPEMPVRGDDGRLLPNP
jgi:hypothetical protein